MPTIFEHPTIALLPDSAGARYYANVNNRMEVSLVRESYHVAVAVPTEFFTLLKEHCGVSPDEEVTLAIDEDGERFVFSILAGDNLWDVWSYSERSLPEWITEREYRL